MTLGPHAPDVTGREHPPTGATGSAFEATPFRAVQVAAWETLART